MLYANRNGEKVRAMPGASATCPGCGEGVIAKCGEINIWHWAHMTTDCDPWYEPESAWHVGWKLLASPERCEVRMGNHRADIVTPSGFILELQHSALSPDQVQDRERFYGHKLIWLIDASEFDGNLIFRARDGYSTFRWKWPRKWQFSANRSIIWDFGDGDDLFMVKKIHAKVPCGGWGNFIDRDTFVDGHFGSLNLSHA